MTQEGVDFVTNTEIGKDITADELKNSTMRLSFAQGPKTARSLD
ncbi:hypothetical protein PO124_18760 [Bacillus licheniformis]|nr:hypothetical protein [Bacillus licheniformis]